MHWKEITQLQEDLKSKEDQLRELKDMLQKSQENLAQVEHRLESQYTYLAQGEDFIQDENLKTSLQADKVNYHLKIANIHFAKAEMQLKLKVQESKMQRSKQMNQVIQSKMQQADTSKKPVAKPKGSLPSQPIKRSKFSSQSTRTPSKPKCMEESEQRTRAKTESAADKKPSGYRPRTGTTASQIHH